MRLLGIDFGTKRVGLAMTTPDGTMPLPYRTITRTARETLFVDIAAIIADEKVEAVVVGYPLRLDGEPSLTSRQASNFALSLKRRTGLQVFLVREELTSCEAESMLRETGMRYDRQKQVLDQIAAVRILDAYLAAPENSQEVTL
jgi:putative holliday junction resolvase